MGFQLASFRGGVHQQVPGPAQPEAPQAEHRRCGGRAHRNRAEGSSCRRGRCILAADRNFPKEGIVIWFPMSRGTHIWLRKDSDHASFRWKTKDVLKRPLMSTYWVQILTFIPVFFDFILRSCFWHEMFLAVFIILPVPATHSPAS